MQFFSKLAKPSKPRVYLFLLMAEWVKYGVFCRYLALVVKHWGFNRI